MHRRCSPSLRRRSAHTDTIDVPLNDVSSQKRCWSCGMFDVDDITLLQLSQRRIAQCLMNDVEAQEPIAEFGDGEAASIDRN
jgi:hypothetical protein